MKLIMTLGIASFFQQRYTNFLLECHKNTVFWARTTRVCNTHENGMPISTQNDSGHVLTHIFELFVTMRGTQSFLLLRLLQDSDGCLTLLNKYILTGTVQKLYASKV